MYDLQEWLEDFVEFVREKWRKFHSTERKIVLGGYQKDIKEYSSKEDILSTTEMGKRSEEFVRDQILLIKNWDGPHYCTHRTKNSETPSDVWGIKSFGSVYGNYIHLFLIQVKSTQKYLIPEPLTIKEIDELKEFADFVFDEYINYAMKPESFSSKNHLVVSCGYAGVKIEKDNSWDLSLKDSKLYKYVLRDRKSKENKRLLLQQVKYIHKLGIK